jgi:hypothetical protein
LNFLDKVDATLIKCRHIFRIPPSRLYLRIRDIIRRRIKGKKIISEKEQYSDLSRTFNNCELNDFIINCRGYDPKGNETLNPGEYSIRGFVRKLGDFDKFNWCKLLSPNEEDVNWLYELTYLSIFLKKDFLTAQECTELISCLDNFELETHRNYSSASLAWSVISVSNRLINIYSIAYNLANHCKNPKVLQRVIIHGNICRSFLEEFTEYYLHYNHLLFGISAQIIWDSSNVNYKPTIEYDEYCSYLEEQINQDGLHAELSPTYHLHVGFLTKAVIQSHSDSDSEVINRLVVHYKRMSDAIGTLIHPDGEIAIFSDSAIFDAPIPVNVFPELSNKETYSELPFSGYYRLQNSVFSVVLDAGPLGPFDNPGHGHIDYLSIEISLLGKRLVVDPGVASYKSGSLRLITRSSQSHNGPKPNGEKLAELAGAFQVGGMSNCSLIHKNIKNKSSLVIGETTVFNNKSKKIRRLLYLFESTIIVIDLGINTKLSETIFIIDDDWNHHFGKINSNDIHLNIRGHEGTSVVESKASYYPYGPGVEIQSTAYLITPSTYFDDSFAIFTFQNNDEVISKSLLKSLTDLIRCIDV